MEGGGFILTSVCQPLGVGIPTEPSKKKLPGPSNYPYKFKICWETFYMFAYCGFLVEIQPLKC